ncbi:integrin alpha-L-like isoform X2 [Eleutherodactylus coqui]|uniref:integrin alpha-L-like isoform X2 n=1 Tax=Eleutherodactylus coqui TaxID=57060 RepID=UPI0034622638
MDSYRLLLLLSLLGDVDISLTYNVEVLEHRRFSTEVGSFFGYKVVQFNSSSGERILIGDPSSNKLHICDAINETCDNITLPNMDRTLHLGLTLEVEPVSSRCLVCGSDKPHDCSKTLYMNGACYTVDSSLTASVKRTPGYQVCQKVEVDLCFLFDDSFSVGTPEFASVKSFLLKAILNLKNSTVNFAVVQYGSKPQKIFDFKDYKLGEGEKRIENMEHKGGATNTYKAIRFTLDEIFTPAAGVRQEAKRILLLLTDGEANDKNNGDTEAADKQKVTRYIIGVGKNFILERNTELASKPPESHMHVMQDYSNLEGFFKELQTKILAIEGVAQGSNFSREMSSAALSAALTEDREILGDPGIFDWSGGILEQEQLVYMSSKEEDRNGYLGYSVKLLHTGKGLLCVVGSPRYQYVGLVTVLQEVAGEPKWKKIDSLLGKQVGSYFGAEIAVSDLDQDGMTDLVLISAPHHYEAKWSGQVSVCRFMEKLECTVTLHGEPGHLQSQFGTAVSSLGDLDGDGFTEVAVGAPYEMDGKGALYIYKGEAAGLSDAHSQRLLSPPGVLGFGLSIHGVLDMTEDGLIDVVVGSRGHVTLHRSQPLLKVSISVTSNQTYMVVSSLKASDCDSKLILEACVQVEILTPKYTGPLSISIQYSLLLDFHRPESRILFTNKQSEMNGTVAIQGPGAQCQNYTVFLQDCGVEDLSEVQVSLTAFPMQIHAPWLVSPSSSLGATNLIFLQICEEAICEMDMSIKVTHSPLVVQDGASFSMFLSLHNMDMKAHQTRLTVGVPDGLSFRKANVTEASYRISLVCGDFKEQILMCNVSHPSLKRGVWAVIQIMFSIVSNVSWPDRILLAVNVTSHENQTSSGAEYEVPVLYPIHIIVRSLEESTKHVPFISQDSRATAAHGYQIQNLGLRAAPINLRVSVSPYEARMKSVSWDFFISFSQDSNVKCSEFSDSSAIQTQRKTIYTITNQTWHCIMNTSGEMTINITGPLKPMNPWKKAESVSMRSEVTIQYDGLRYYSDMGSTFHAAQLVTQVELLVSPDHTLYIVGGTVGGVMALILLSFLLYKCGFFKRYKDRMMEDLPLHDDPQLLAAPKGEVTEAAAQLIGPQES